MNKVNTLARESQFDKIFESVSEPIAHLVKKLLAFNPADRSSCTECLKDPMFDSIRNKNIEKKPEFVVDTPADSLDFVDENESYIKVLRKEISKIKHSKLLQKLRVKE